MDQIQFLTDKQVKILFSALVPELHRLMEVKIKALSERAEKERFNFETSKDYLDRKLEIDKRIENFKRLMAIEVTLKEIGKEYFISSGGYYNEGHDEKILNNLIENYDQELNSLLIRLSEKNLMVNATWIRLDQMHNDLRAQLSTTVARDFEIIKKEVLDSFDVNKYFNYTL